MNLGTITDSSSSADTHGFIQNVGGLVGAVWSDGVIMNSHSSGEVTTAAGGSRGGGLVGESQGSIIDCSSSSNVQTGQGYAGGLVGSIRYDGEVVRSFATGNVSSNQFWVGGLVGIVFDGSITDSYSTGDVVAGYLVGGLVGESRGDISNSYSTGAVEADQDPFGGLVGESDGVITDSFWDEETSGITEGEFGEPRETASFDDGTFGGWNFSDTWVIGIAPDGETRPILQWQ